VAARLAQGCDPAEIGAESAAPLRFADWPDELGEIIYCDVYGNAMTGLRAANMPAGAMVKIGERLLPRAATFADKPKGTGFWYENSIGLVEIAVSQGRATDAFGLEVGARFTVECA
jgi:S-adenosylmethionine hydrolase